MKTITITVKVGDNELYRNYAEEALEAKSTEEWGEEVVSMLNIIESSNDGKF